jgi:hypothetical protein
VLILNATSLNTGHNWQFTATYMGEAPTSIEPVVDATERLRRMYYREAPRPYNEIELFMAVGASSAAPGVFPRSNLSAFIRTELYACRTAVCTIIKEYSG